MSRPPRIKGFDYLGCVCYFLTFCTLDRRTTFRDTAAVDLALAQFRRTTRLWSFATLAYCFMPDHVHLLIEGTTPAANLKRVAKRLKQGSGQAWSFERGRDYGRRAITTECFDPVKIPRRLRGTSSRIRFVPGSSRILRSIPISDQMSGPSTNCWTV